MAQSVEYLSHIHKDVSPDPKHPHKNPGTAEGEAKERRVSGTRRLGLLFDW